MTHPISLQTLYLFLSSSLPITASLRRTPAVASTLPVLECLITSLDRNNTNITLARSGSAATTCSHRSLNRLTTCNYYGSKCKGPWTSYYISIGIPVLETTCQSEFYVDRRSESLLGMSDDAAYDVPRNHASALNGAALRLVDEWKCDNLALRTQVTKWNEITTSAGNISVSHGETQQTTVSARRTNFPYAGRDQQCTLDHIVFVRA